MAQTQIKKFTFAEFLDYDSEDYRVELEDGLIIIMPTPSPLHIQTLCFLYSRIEQDIKNRDLPLEL